MQKYIPEILLIACVVIVIFFFQSFSGLGQSIGASLPIQLGIMQSKHLFLVVGLFFYLLWNLLSVLRIFKKDNKAGNIGNSTFASPVNAIDIAFFIYLILNYISTFWAVNPATAFQASNLLCIGFLTYASFKIALVKYPRFTEKYLLRIFTLCAFYFMGHYTINAIATYQELIATYPTYTLGGDLFYHVKNLAGHKNTVAIYAYALSVLCVLNLLGSNKMWRIVSGVCLGLLLLMILLVFTRSVFVAVIVGLLFFGLVYSARFAKTAFFDANKRKIALIGLGVFVVGIVVTALLWRGNLEKLHPETLGSRSIEERFEFWRRAALLIGEKPLLGWGNYNWKYNYVQFGAAGIQRMETGMIFDQPHNDWIRNLVDLGVLGLLSYLSIYVLQLKSVFQSLKNWVGRNVNSDVDSDVDIDKSNQLPKNTAQNIDVKIVIVIAAITGIHFIELFDGIKASLTIVTFVVVLWALLAFYVHQSRSLDKSLVHDIARKMNRKQNFVYLLVLCLMGFLCAGYYGMNFRETQKMRVAYKLTKQKQWEEAKTILNTVQPFFCNEFRGQPTPTYLAMVNRRLGEQETAIKEYEKALEQQQYNYQTLGALGMTYLEMKDDANAEKYLMESRNLNICYEPTNLALARLYIRQKEMDKADALLNEIVLNEKGRETLRKKLRKNQVKGQRKN